MRSEKDAIRKSIKSVVDKISKPVKLEKANKLVENLRSFLRSQLPNIDPTKSMIGVYAPMSDEIDGMSALEEWHQRMGFPVLNETGKMVFKRCRPAELAVSRDFGVEIFGPPSEAFEVEVDILIVPGRAFDLHGRRLGRGKGFYDRFLANFDGPKIGVCFQEQIVEEVPVEAHDVKMNAVITDKNILGVK